MPQSLSQIYLHFVYSTKNRAPFLVDSATRNDLHAYLGGILRNHDSPPLIVGGTADHVHALCRLARTISVADLMRELKRDSSKWIKDHHRDVAEFHWQVGYGAFSVGRERVEIVRHYIANQEQHHKQITFQDEYRRILTEYGVEYDERYVWD
jgi:REP element-mobilizing transposase RayT